MSKFKVGDKVVVGGGDIKTIARVDKWRDGEYGYYFNIDDELLNYYEEEDLELYKSAHEKLLELGFNFWDNSNGLQYDRKEIGILIDKETKTYKTYWVVDDMAFSVDLELSKILTQYLEELEEENDK